MEGLYKTKTFVFTNVLLNLQLNSIMTRPRQYADQLGALGHDTIQLRLSNQLISEKQKSLFRIGLPCISVCKLTALCQFVMELNG